MRSAIRVALAAKASFWSSILFLLCLTGNAFNSIRRGLPVPPFGPGLCYLADYCYRLGWVRDRRLSPLQLRFREWAIDTAKNYRAEMGAFFESRQN